ncbi:hypothetical protein P9112_014243 [Eukaryota sp. TZLM1-RC]
MISIDLKGFEEKVTQFCESISSQVKQHVDEHSEVLASLRSTQDSLSQKKADLQKQIQQLQSKASEDRRRIQSLEDRIINFSSTNSTLKSQVNDLEQRLSSVEVDLDARAKFIMEEEAKTQHLISHLRKGPDFYRKHLGIWFEKSGGVLQVNFVYIDRISPSRQFFFKLAIINNQYRMIDSNPKISLEDQNQLVEDLNYTNSLSVFVIKIRNLFISIVRG